MDVMVALTLFVLAVFLGVELITKVPPTLHTPLMSGSNAISGITSWAPWWLPAPTTGPSPRCWASPR